MNELCAYKFLVIDNQDLLDINNLRRTVNQAIKHPEPVLTMDAPWDQDDERLSYSCVIYDEEERIFKMWYAVWRNESQVAGVIVPGTVKLAYATSTDGVSWQRPQLGLIEVNGSRKNNYVIPEMAFYGFSIIKDLSDIPARRFKMISMGALMRLQVHFSPDGLSWTRGNEGLTACLA